MTLKRQYRQMMTTFRERRTRIELGTVDGIMRQKDTDAFAKSKNKQDSNLTELNNELN